MERPWAVVLGLGILLCPGLAWLLNFRPAPDQLGTVVGVVLIVLGLLALLTRVGPLAAVLDQLGLGQPRTPRERRLSAAFTMAGSGIGGLLFAVRGPRPGFLMTFVWLGVTFTVLTVLYLGARRWLVSAPM